MNAQKWHCNLSRKLSVCFLRTFIQRGEILTIKIMGYWDNHVKRGKASIRQQKNSLFSYETHIQEAIPNLFHSVSLIQSQ